jgi:hypothetical protein
MLHYHVGHGHGRERAVHTVAVGNVIEMEGESVVEVHLISVRDGVDGVREAAYLVYRSVEIVI